MSKGAKTNPAQLTFAIFAPAEILPKGDGTFVVKPGKPLTELTPKQLAEHYRKDRETVYRWIDDGTIPENFIRYCGKREIWINAEIIPLLAKVFREEHE